MKGILDVEVEIIKFDGTNKDDIINKLKITENINEYFKYDNMYFVIPKHDESDWFILNETLFKRKVHIIPEKV